MTCQTFAIFFFSDDDESSTTLRTDAAPAPCADSGAAGIGRGASQGAQRGMQPLAPVLRVRFAFLAPCLARSRTVCPPVTSECVRWLSCHQASCGPCESRPPWRTPRRRCCRTEAYAPGGWPGQRCRITTRCARLRRPPPAKSAGAYPRSRASSSGTRRGRVRSPERGIFAVARVPTVLVLRRSTSPPRARRHNRAPGRACASRDGMRQMRRMPWMPGNRPSPAAQSARSTAPSGARAGGFERNRRRTRMRRMPRRGPSGRAEGVHVRR